MESGHFDPQDSSAAVLRFVVAVQRGQATHAVHEAFQQACSSLDLRGEGFAIDPPTDPILHAECAAANRPTLRQLVMDALFYGVITAVIAYWLAVLTGVMHRPENRSLIRLLVEARRMT